MSSLRDLSLQASFASRFKFFIQMTLLAFGLLILVAMIILIFGEQPLRRWWASTQSRRHLVAAKAAIERQDYLAAMRAAQQAAHLTPEEPELLRTWVHVLAGLNAHPDEVLGALARVEAAGGMTSEMLLKRVEAHIHRGDMLAAMKLLQALPAAQRQSWEAVSLEATLILRQGRTAEGDANMLTTTEVANTPAAIFLRAVRDLAESQDEVKRTHARQILWQAAREDSARQRIALTLLSRDPSLTAVNATELLELVTPISDAQQLRHAVLKQVFRLLPERKEALIAAESERVADSPAVQQLRHVLFLAQEQAPNAMDVFLRDHGRILASERPADYVSLQLEILAKTDDWQAVRQKLKTKAARQLDSLSFNLWEANSIAALTPNSPLVLKHLQLAYEATQNGQNLTGAIRVADVALNLNQAAFAAACYEQIAAKPLLMGEKIRLLEKACHALLASRNTPALRRTAHALADLTPGHPDHTYRAYYFDILYGVDFEVIALRLDLHKLSTAGDATAMAHQRLLEAMIYSRMGQTEKLSRALEGLEKAISWNAGERAVLAGLLAKAGESARAWQLAEKLPKALLLPEEASLAQAAW
jgi:hypothetical protein